MAGFFCFWVDYKLQIKDWKVKKLRSYKLES